LLESAITSPTTCAGNVRDIIASLCAVEQLAVSLCFANDSSVHSRRV
jgi:hypothetical protein